MTSHTCPSCSHAIPEHAPAGICPKCLLQAGIGNAAATVAPKGTYSIPTADSLIGKFPNLEIEYLIGQGGMGAVYKARQTNLDRVVALKILSPQLGDDPTFAERFTREARTLAKLSHPNIVTVFDFGVADSMHYLVMEFIDGVNLRDTIMAIEYNSTKALAVISQVCDALQYAHDEGVVHRDIKPENILVDRNGGVKIADFGLAKLLSPTPEEFTLTGTRQVLGTLKYMAPEQIEKPEQVDHRADLYSLGVVFYELLTGELPIGRFAVPSAKAEINRRLDEVVLKTLEKEPNERYQQASEIKTAVAAASIAHAKPQPIEAAIAVPAYVPPAAPNAYAVPFKTDDMYGGMCNGYGIAKLVSPNAIRLEIEVEDCFGATKIAQKTVDVPIDQLSTIKFRSGFFKDKITIQASSFAAIGDIPSAKQGSLNLYTKKADSLAAEQLTIAIHNRLPTSAKPYGTTVPTPPIKQSWTAENNEDIRAAHQSLRIPMFGFYLVGFLYFLTAICGSVGRWGRLPKPHFHVPAPIEWLIDIGGPQFSDSFIAIAWLGVALMFSTAYMLWRKENYGLTFSLLVLCCLPLHPLAVLSFIFAIWSLIVICTPAGREVFSRKRNFGFVQAKQLMLAGVPIFALVICGFCFANLVPARYSGADKPTTVITSEIAKESSSEIESAGISIVEGTAAAKMAETPPVRNSYPVDLVHSPPPITTSFDIRIGALLVIGVVVSVAFLTVMGLIFYLLFRKPSST